MKIVYISEESVATGYIKTGIAEVVDSIAHTVYELGHDVTVITRDGNGYFTKFSTQLEDCGGYRTVDILGVRYYMIKPGQNFAEGACNIAASLIPDCVHNFAEIGLIDKLKDIKCKTVYTIDRKEEIVGKHNYIFDYDYVTTVSQEYSKELLNNSDDISEALKARGNRFIGITNGILSQVFDPSSGLFVEQKYNSIDQDGKRVCKEYLNGLYKVDASKILYMYSGRLSEEKGIDALLECVNDISESNGQLIIVGVGDSKYESRLKELMAKKQILWIRKMLNPVMLIPVLSGSDFYIAPSVSEPCGLMPMTASRYGTIPIVSMVGGMIDTMDPSMSIAIESNLRAAIKTSVEVYSDTNKLYQMRKNAMEKDFSWTSRIQKYIDIYERSLKDG